MLTYSSPTLSRITGWAERPKGILKMVNKGWKLGDAIHYLTMVKHNIKEIVTDDGHFDNLKGIERIDIQKLNF